MMHLKLYKKKKNLFAIFLGFSIIVVMGVVTSIISLLIGFNQESIPFIGLLIKTIPVISLILGGYAAGWYIREKGALYGGITGLILAAVSISIASLPFFLPTSFIFGQHVPSDYGYGMAQKNILNQLLYLPVTIVLTSLGGLLGEKHYKKKQHHSS